MSETQIPEWDDKAERDALVLIQADQIQADEDRNTKAREYVEFVREKARRKLKERLARAQEVEKEAQACLLDIDLQVLLDYSLVKE